jgi:Sortase domain
MARHRALALHSAVSRHGALVRSRRSADAHIRRRTALRLTLAAVALVAGLVALLARPAPAPTAPAAAERRPAVTVPAVLEAPSSPADAPAPTSVAVPAAGIRTGLVPLTVDPAGTLTPPQDTATAGWFAQGPAPGAVGPAVLVGHVDSWRGPGAFYRLVRVAAGEEVLVSRADGSTVRFTVTRVARYPKDAFPTAEVYGPTPDPELRLITCGGTFDRAARSYEENVVVYARAR